MKVFYFILLFIVLTVIAGYTQTKIQGLNINKHIKSILVGIIGIAALTGCLIAFAVMFSGKDNPTTHQQEPYQKN
jgi:uncharacterized protein YxeA